MLTRHQDALRQFVECNPRKGTREFAVDFNTCQSTICRHLKNRKIEHRNLKPNLVIKRRIVIYFHDNATLHSVRVKRNTFILKLFFFYLNHYIQQTLDQLISIIFVLYKTLSVIKECFSRMSGEIVCETLDEESTSSLINSEKRFNIIVNIRLIEINSSLNSSLINIILLKRKLFMSNLIYSGLWRVVWNKYRSSILNMI